MVAERDSMDREETQSIITELAALYEGNFPKLNMAMSLMWGKALTPVDPDVGIAAVERWARHHTFKAPTLDEFLEQVEICRDEAQQAKRWGTGDKNYLDTLRDAAETQASNPLRTEDDATYARLMVILAERSVTSWIDKKGVRHDKLTLDQRCEQLARWAKHYEQTHPQLCQDLIHGLGRIMEDGQRRNREARQFETPAIPEMY